MDAHALAAGDTSRLTIMSSSVTYSDISANAAGVNHASASVPPG